MKRFFITVLCAGLLIIVGAGAYTYFFLDDLLLSQINKQGSARFAAFEIKKLHLALLPKVSLHLETLHLLPNAGAPDILVSAIHLDTQQEPWQLLQTIRAQVPLQLTLDITDPSIKLSEAAESTSSNGPLVTTLPYPLSATIRLTNAKVKRGALEIFLPKASVAIEATTAKISDTTLEMAGIRAQVTGTLDLAKQLLQLRLTANAPDLAKLALQPAQLSALSLTQAPHGALSFTADANGALNGELAVVGNFSASNLELALAVDNKGSRPFTIQGPLKGSVSAPFSLKYNIPQAKLLAVESNAIDARADLSATTIQAPGVFEKSAGVAMTAHLKASATGDKAHIQELNFHLYNLSLLANGDLSVDENAANSIGFDLKIASLQAWPNLFPALREEKEARDASGAIVARGTVTGSRKDAQNEPGKLNIVLENFQATNLSLPLSYASEALKANGRLTADIKASGRWQNGKASANAATAKLDLTQMSLDFKDLVKKTKGHALALDLNAQGNEQSIQLQRLDLRAKDIHLTAAGRIQQDKDSISPNLDMSFDAKVERLREWLPTYAKQIPVGATKGKYKLSGQWLMSGGIEKSPLLLNGQVSAQLGNIVLAEAEKSVSTNKTPGPLLPPWPLLQEAKLAYDISLASLKRGPLELGALTLKGHLNAGTLSATGHIASIFGGAVDLNQFSASLSQAQMNSSASLGLKNIDLKPAAAFVSPEYKNLVGGRASGQVQFSTPDPSSNDLLLQTKATGSLQVTDGFLSTASFTEAIQKKLSAIPVLGAKANISTQNIHANATTRFTYADGVLTLLSFNSLSPEKNELNLAGTVKLDLGCNLQGKAHLATLHVGGSIQAANSDAQGRLVVPLQFSGNLKEPQVSIATETISAMMQKTAAYEKEKVSANLKNSAQQEIEKQKKNAKNQLQDMLKKSIPKF